jgi:hypothetical protein
LGAAKRRPVGRLWVLSAISAGAIGLVFRFVL